MHLLGWRAQQRYLSKMQPREGIADVCETTPNDGVLKVVITNLAPDVRDRWLVDVVCMTQSSRVRSWMANATQECVAELEGSIGNLNLCVCKDVLHLNAIELTDTRVNHGRGLRANICAQE